jgi:hypothetical protein
MATIELDEMLSRGACKHDIDILRPLYEGEILILHPDELETMSDVNVFWGTKMLDVPHQKTLALLWYDRAMVSSSAPWKAEVRALIDAPDAAAAKAHSAGRGTDIRSAGTVTDECEAGVAQALAALCLLYARGHGIGSRAVCRVIIHYARWCVRCISDVESITPLAAEDSLRVDVLTSLDLNGVVALP